MPEHLLRFYDQDYWRQGAGTWLVRSGIGNIKLEVGATTLIQAKNKGNSFGVTTTLNPGDWMMVADPKTNKR